LPNKKITYPIAVDATEEHLATTLVRDGDRIGDFPVGNEGLDRFAFASSTLMPMTFMVHWPHTDSAAPVTPASRSGTDRTSRPRR